MIAGCCVLGPRETGRAREFMECLVCEQGGVLYALFHIQHELTFIAVLFSCLLNTNKRSNCV